MAITDREREIKQLRHDAQMARSVLGETIRRIRVTIGKDSFIVDVWRGRVCGVTGPHSEYLGMDETEAATELRATGASFADVS